MRNTYHLDRVNKVELIATKELLKFEQTSEGLKVYFLNRNRRHRTQTH